MTVADHDTTHPAAGWRTRWNDTIVDESRSVALDHLSGVDDEVQVSELPVSPASGGVLLDTEPGREALAARPRPQPVVVGSGVGGAGVTVTSLLLTSALTARAASAIAVDGTAVGGDLHRRAGLPEDTLDWQGWLRGGADQAVLPRTGGDDEAPAVLRRDPTVPDYLSPLAAVTATLAAAGRVPVVDAGAALGSMHCDGVLELAGTLVVVVPDRADAANRMRPVLTGLVARYGVERLSQTHIVVAAQARSWSPTLFTLRDNLGDRVAGVHALDYDVELAWGQTVPADRLAAASTAITELADTIVGAGVVQR